MRLAISNIAWRPAERLAVYRRMAECGAGGLEIAPAQAFPDEPDAFLPSQAAVARFRGELEIAGIRLVSMQSLLAGVAGARLFGTPAERETFKQGLSRAVALAGRLGIPNLVMGSPGNRVIPEGLARADAELIAVELFRRVGDICLRASTRLAIEPNAAAYGTNFLNTMPEAISFVRRVGHPGITLNFDIGALHMNGDFTNGGRLFAEAAAVASHVHVSEPGLAEAPADTEGFAGLAREIIATGYTGWFSLEMRAVGERNIGVVEAALARTATALSTAESAVE
jgi:sugar phosphate isomerase/epimerase